MTDRTLTPGTKPILSSNLSDVSLPCPFCGGVPAFVKEGSTFRWRVMECQSCGARCGEVRVQTVGEGTPKDWEEQVVPKAIAEWNKRHTIETFEQPMLTVRSRGPLGPNDVIVDATELVKHVTFRMSLKISADANAQKAGEQS